MNCVQIEGSNEMGTEVDNKGKQPLHPMPNEVVLPPTAEEDPKTPEGGNDEGMEEPPSNKRRNYGHYHQEDGPTHFCKVILAPKLECIPCPWTSPSTSSRCRRSSSSG